MSLKDLAKLVDLKALDKVEKYDPTKARTAAITLLDKTLTTFNTDPKTKGKKYFRLVNDGVALTLPFKTGLEKKLSGAKGEFEGIPLSMAGFPDAIKAVKAAVTAGELDEALKGGGAPKVKRAGWTPERRARQAESIAKRNAKK